MEVETGGVCREYSGKVATLLYRTLDKLPPARRRDKFQLHITVYDFGYITLPNLKMEIFQQRCAV
jgi:hypothetical protein